MRLKINTRSLKFKIWGYFGLFAAIIMVTLWLIQIVFLKTFYQSMKTAQIQKIGDTIAAEYGKSDFAELIYRLSYNNGFVVQIFDEKGLPQFRSNSFGGMAAPRTDSLTVTTLIEKLAASKTGKTAYIARDERVHGQILVYGAVLPDTGNGTRYLYINSQIAPVDSTTAVLQTQLVIVMVIALLLSLGISILIATRLSRPITRLTQSADELARGNYGVRFEPGSYSEITQLADTLNYATKELSRTDELRRELIANISHDLRTPLTMVKMYAELIRDVSGDKPDKRDAHTRVIIEESDRLSALITDMLDLSRIQAGTAPLNRSEFDLGDKTRVILNRFHALTEREGYRFDLLCEGEMPVNADEQKLEQVIYNLVGNAVNYTGKDKTVAICLRRVGERVRFEVTDTGPGIPPEELHQIWERYYRASRTKKHAVVGTGLGLSITKGILEAHGAAYGVESTVGLGSTFWFEL